MDIQIESWSEEEARRQKTSREEEDEVLIYSVGSKGEASTGGGVCRMSQEGDEWGRLWGNIYKMGKRVEIMDAEMVGIKKTIQWGLMECRDEEKKKRITVRVDSQEAMRRCRVWRRGGGEMILGKVRKLVRAGGREGIVVRMEWVKGHAKIWGKEEAEKRSKKEAKNKGNKDKVAFSLEAWMLRLSKEEMVIEWSTKWDGDVSRQCHKPPETPRFNFLVSAPLSLVLVSSFVSFSSYVF